MKHTMRSAALAACLSATLLAGCATAPEGGLAAADRLLQGANPAHAVSLVVKPPQVRVGDTLSLQLASALPGYLYVLQVDTSGKATTLLFPNAVDGANYLPGGSAVTTLPRPNWRMAARGPAGVGYFVAVVTEKPQDLTALAAQLPQGPLMLQGAYGAAMASVREVAP